MRRLARLRRSLYALFPERHLYVRSGGRMRAYVLSTKKQMMIAGGVGAAAVWMGVCTAAMLVNAVSATPKAGRAVAFGHGPAAASVEQVTAQMEHRYAALALLLTDLKGAPGAAQAITPAIGEALSQAKADPANRLAALQAGQDKVLAAADAFAKGRADHYRAAFKAAGLKPSAFPVHGGGVGGPLVELNDPKALSAVLDVDADFAQRIQHAAANVSDERALASAAQHMPLARPTSSPEQSSGFGVRSDPFTGEGAFHTGLDFPGGRMTPVYATGPGVVAFTGFKAGYGRVVEVDHGGGLRTRYAHLATVGVHPGEHVGPGQRLGGMGSSGRSTGTHLHYEVWLNGKAVNPVRFIRAGQLVREAG
jgi:murein DD-endopeptidase MepM/ murein hydrolase activator NlpD